MHPAPNVPPLFTRVSPCQLPYRESPLWVGPRLRRESLHQRLAIRGYGVAPHPHDAFSPRFRDAPASYLPVPLTAESSDVSVGIDVCPPHVHHRRMLTDSAGNPKSPPDCVHELEAADPFDDLCGTDTKLEMPRPSGTHVPVSVRAFAAGMSAVRVRHEDFVFVDIGSGKGRALMLASAYPFKRCIGVELDPDWHAIAQKNLTLWHSPSQRCTDLRVFCADATTFDYPREDLFISYYNSLGPQGLVKLLDNLKQSVASHPRRIVFLYSCQDDGDEVVKHALLHVWGTQGDTIHRWGPGGRNPNAPYPIYDGKFPFAVYSNF